MATTESSVLVNLKDIFEMEADRRATEAVAKERAKAEEAARIEAERRAREAELEAARAEERRRAEAERAARDAELELRLRTLKDELAQVRTQREEMRAQVADRLVAEPPRASRGSWIAGVMAAASLVAAIGATAVAWPREGEPVAQLTPVETVEHTSEVTPVVEPVATPEPVVVAQPDPEPVAVARPRPHRPRPTQDTHTSLGDQLNFDDDEDDVLGHLSDSDR